MKVLEKSQKLIYNEINLSQKYIGNNLTKISEEIEEIKLMQYA